MGKVSCWEFQTYVSCVFLQIIVLWIEEFIGGAKSVSGGVINLNIICKSG